VCRQRILVQGRVHQAADRNGLCGEGPEDGFEPGAVIGALIDMKAVKKAHIADAVKKGAKLAVGGGRSALGSTFFEPMVLIDVTTDMVTTKEETLEPAVPLYRFKTDADAIKIANDAQFGLAAYFYNRDIGRIWRVAEGLEYGIVGINESVISARRWACAHAFSLACGSSARDHRAQSRH